MIKQISIHYFKLSICEHLIFKRFHYNVIQVAGSVPPSACRNVGVKSNSDISQPMNVIFLLLKSMALRCAANLDPYRTGTVTKTKQTMFLCLQLLKGLHPKYEFFRSAQHMHCLCSSVCSRNNLMRNWLLQRWY